jgi:cell division protein FtsQ
MNAILRIAAWIVAIALVTLPVVAVLNGWIGGSRWPMRHLVVTGEFRLVKDAEVRDAVLPAIRDGFFAVHLDQVRNAVARLPWVQRVEVRKRWPDRLEVLISEYRPLARWGEKQMLSENGELFPVPKDMDVRVPRPQDAQERPQTAMAALPQFAGPLDRRGDLMTLYSDAKPLFLGSGLQVTRVELSARGSWNLWLSDGMEIEVGRNDPELRLQRFARLLPKLRSHDARVLVRADLRYTNGFALTWQTTAQAPSTTNPTATQANT